MTDAPEIGFIDNPMAPDIFADDATGFFIANGSLRITFEAARVSHVSSPGPINRVVIGRLVISVGGAERLARGILDFLEQQKVTHESTSQGTPTVQ